VSVPAHEKPYEPDVGHVTVLSCVHVLLLCVYGMQQYCVLLPFFVPLLQTSEVAFWSGVSELVHVKPVAPCVQVTVESCEQLELTPVEATQQYSILSPELIETVGLLQTRGLLSAGDAELVGSQDQPLPCEHMTVVSVAQLEAPPSALEFLTVQPAAVPSTTNANAWIERRNVISSPSCPRRAYARGQLDGERAESVQCRVRLA